MFLAARFWGIVDANWTVGEQDACSAAISGMASPNSPESDPPTLEQL